MCIPALHLDLRIFLWIFNAIVADFQALDACLAAHLGSTGSHADDTTTFTAVASLNSKINEERDMENDQPQSGSLKEFLS